MIPCSHTVIDGGASGIIFDMEAAKPKLDPWGFSAKIAGSWQRKERSIRRESGGDVGRHSVAKEGNA